MRETLEAAVIERITLGYSKEAIIDELIQAGYSEVKAASVYQTVVTENPKVVAQITPAPVVSETTANDILKEQVVAPSVSTPTTAAVSPAAEAEQNLAQTSPNSPPRTWPKYTIFIVIQVIVVLVVISLAVAGVFSPLVSKVTSLFSNAPYSTEAEFLSGIVTSSRSLGAYAFTAEYQFALEERTSEAKEIQSAMLPDGSLNLLTMQLPSIPAEGVVNLSLSGLLDVRNSESPAFDISTNLNVMAEPILFNAAASVRLVDGVLYGRLDDVPRNFQGWLPATLPLQTWITLLDTADMSDFQAPFVPMVPPLLQEALRGNPAAPAELYVAEAYRLLALNQSGVAVLAQQAQQQLGAVTSALGLNLTQLGTTDIRMINRSIELLAEHPFIVFAAEPTDVTAEIDIAIDSSKERYYQYDIDIDYDNLRSYLLQLVADSEEITGEVIPLTPQEILESLPSRTTIDEFNRLTDISLVVRADGSIARSHFESLVTIDEPNFPNQLALNFTVTQTRHDDGVTVQVPDELHEKSLPEIFESQYDSFHFETDLDDDFYEDDFDSDYSDDESRAQYGGESEYGSTIITDTVTKQQLTNIRSYAEISYNNNGFSFDEVCVEGRVQESLSSLLENYTETFEINRDSASAMGKIVCNDQDQSYAIIVPLPSDLSRSWCVDSSGYLDEVSPDVLESAIDTSCD